MRYARVNMSGGSYDYLYYKIEDAGRRLTGANEPDYRRAFGALLIKVAHAMYQVEWVDSSDKSPGDDKEAIMKCITPRDIMACSIERAEKMLEELKEFVDKYNNELS